MGLGWLLGLFFSWSLSAENFIPNSGRCEEFPLSQELRVYKDPQLLRDRIRALAEDPNLGWTQIEEENPLLVTRKGPLKLKLMSDAEPFHGYNTFYNLFLKNKVAKIDCHDEPPAIIRVAFCGDNDAYRGYVGFVFESELKKATQEEASTGLRPSTRTFIPEYPATKKN